MVASAPGAKTASASSGSAPTDPSADAMFTETLSGWGGWPRSSAQVFRPSHSDQLGGLKASPRGLLARGLGRSYGDAAQLSGGTVVQTDNLSGILEFDSRVGRITALAGSSLGELLAVTIPAGWFLPVTPGTRHVTLGGSIAADVHGKNHHRDGSFGSYVEGFRLLTSMGERLEVTPSDDAFLATVGGMGLTGVILQATLRLTPIASTWMLVDTLRAEDIETVMGALAETDRRHRYSVAWLDLTGRSRGRGVVMAGDHAGREQLPPPQRQRPLAYRPRWGIPAPPFPGSGLVNEATVWAFNRLWYARAESNESARLEALDRFFYPLDRLHGWNRLYGARGFLQYQFVVPHDSGKILMMVAETLAQSGAPISLAVLKRMGHGSGGLLSFPMEGWTLAIDMPLVGPELGGLLDRCDQMVSECGGRVYLAKDSRLRPEAARRMYGHLDEWREIQARLDDRGLMRSDLANRLSLLA